MDGEQAYIFLIWKSNMHTAKHKRKINNNNKTKKEKNIRKLLKNVLNF